MSDLGVDWSWAVPQPVTRRVVVVCKTCGPITDEQVFDGESVTVPPHTAGHVLQWWERTHGGRPWSLTEVHIAEPPVIGDDHRPQPRWLHRILSNRIRLRVKLKEDKR